MPTARKKEESYSDPPPIKESGFSGSGRGDSLSRVRFLGARGQSRGQSRGEFLIQTIPYLKQGTVLMLLCSVFRERVTLVYKLRKFRLFYVNRFDFGTLFSTPVV